MKRKMKKLALTRETVRVLGTGNLRGVWAGGDEAVEVRETKTEIKDTQYFSCSVACPDTQYFSCSLACPSKTA